MKIVQEFIERPWLGVLAFFILVVLVYGRDIAAALGKGTTTAVKPFRRPDRGVDSLGCEAAIGALPRVGEQE